MPNLLWGQEQGGVGEPLGAVPAGDQQLSFKPWGASGAYCDLPTWGSGNLFSFLLLNFWGLGYCPQWERRWRLVGLC